MAKLNMTRYEDENLLIAKSDMAGMGIQLKDGLAAFGIERGNSSTGLKLGQ